MSAIQRVAVVIPHSHSWLWTQTCLSSILRHPPHAEGCEVYIYVVDNSPWSHAIKGVTHTRLYRDVPNLIVVPNRKSNRFHASALDCIVEDYYFDYMLAMETDVMVLGPNWLQWFIDYMRPNDYAVGMWHHEQFVNPSCTLYRGDVLRDMNKWCKGEIYVLEGWNPPSLAQVPVDELRWGPLFSKSQPITDRKPEHDYRGWYDDNIDWVAGPFADKRGFLEGTVLEETPSGQCKGPGWYEPGQMLHHWAVQAGFTYTICPTLTTRNHNNTPLQTIYGKWGIDELAFPYPSKARLGPGDHGYNHHRQLEAVEMFGNGQTVHLWGGTRALDILKHDVTCEFVKANTPIWLAREARFWKHVVPEDIQKVTLDLIREFGWHITGQGNTIPGGDDRDRHAVEFVRRCYADGGVSW